MALFATETLARAVRRVAEADVVGARPRRGARVAALRVAEAARRDAAPSGLRAGRVTLVAVRVRGGASGNAERDAATRRKVARGTTLLRLRAAAHVSRVVEAHAEVRQAGEGFERRVVRLDVRVAVEAERTLRSRELRDVTVGAGLVAGQARLHVAASALVTRVARDLRVLRYGVRESGASLRDRRGARWRGRGRGLRVRPTQRREREDR